MEGGSGVGHQLELRSGSMSSCLCSFCTVLYDWRVWEAPKPKQLNIRVEILFVRKLNG